MDKKCTLAKNINDFYRTSNENEIFDASINKIDKNFKKEYISFLDKVDSFPIDLELILSQYENIEIVKVNGVKKGSIKYENDKFLINIASNYGENSERFSFAHELGHYFMDRTLLLEGEELQSNFISNRENNIIEVRANDFAIKLLAPIEIIKKIIEIQNDDDYTISKLILDMQNIFGLSEIAVTNRLKGVGVLK